MVLNEGVVNDEEFSAEENRIKENEEEDEDY